MRLISFLSIFIFGFSFTASSQYSLKGRIIDQLTSEPLPGVSVYFPELKSGGVTDMDGYYSIEKLPGSKLYVQVSILGYKMLAENIDLLVTKERNFFLYHAITEISEVVVTGLSQASEKSRIPNPVSTIQPLKIRQLASNNIIDALTVQPGISQVTTGNGISKPVIRGLGYNRVVVVNDGIRQEGQQWGDEHGIEIDESSIHKVEILKGPASLAYGSDALAGVVHFISAPTLPLGTKEGNVMLNYQTNNGLMGASSNFAGNLNGFVWDTRASAKKAHAYSNASDGFVYGSGFSEMAANGIFGFSKKWGFSHLHLNYYEFMPGIVEGQRDSLSGKFTKEVLKNDSTIVKEIVSERELRSYEIPLPHQRVNHYKAAVNSNFILGKSYLKTIFGVQQNQRKEFNNLFSPEDYGLYFLLNTLTYDIRFVFPEIASWKFSLGLNGMKQDSYNKGDEFIVPEYSLFDAGGFFMLGKSFKKIDVSGGLRLDHRDLHTSNLFQDSLGNKVEIESASSVQRFNAMDRTFSSYSGSLGYAWRPFEFLIHKLNIARGYRAPNIAELSSNGLHEGTFRYEIGNVNLNPEFSSQLDLAIGAEFEHVSAEVNLFYNDINNFIFLEKLNSVYGGDSIADPVDPSQTFKYIQDHAVLKGGEFSIDMHPHPFDWLHFENSFSWVYASRLNVPDSLKNLPMIPPAKFASELRADFKKVGKRFTAVYAKFGMDYYFLQNRFYSAYGTETATPAHALFHVSLGADVKGKSKTLFTLMLNISNLSNSVYQSHLSRLKYAETNFLSGHQGVYNMGRNLSLKLLVPLR